MIERLLMDSKYSANEASIHLCRYNIAKQYCKNKTILDISCGEGYGTKLLKDWGAKRVIGLDISKESIKKARENFEEKNVEYIVHDAINLDCFQDNTFDMVVSFETIEHLSDPKKFLKEIKRVATESAVFIITCPNDYLYYPQKNEHNPYHLKKYKFEDFKNILRGVFDKKDIKYMMGTKAEGFLNTYVDNNIKLKYQKEMINNYFPIMTQKLISDKTIDYNNCSYYIALINIPKLDEQAVIFPTTIYRWEPDPIDNMKVINLSNEAENAYLQKNIKKLINELNKKNKIIEKLEDEKKVLKGKCDFAENKIKEIANSKTYNLSLKIYNIYKKIFRKR